MADVNSCMETFGTDLYPSSHNGNCSHQPGEGDSPVIIVN